MRPADTLYLIGFCALCGCFCYMRFEPCIIKCLCKSNNNSRKVTPEITPEIS